MFENYDFNTTPQHLQVFCKQRFIQLDSNIYKDPISKLLVHRDGYIVAVYNLPYEETPRVLKTHIYTVGKYCYHCLNTCYPWYYRVEGWNFTGNSEYYYHNLDFA